MNQKYELSIFQSKIYNFHTLYKNDPSYNLILCLKIAGNFDIQRFTKIVDMCIAQADIFKATILEKDGKPYHYVDDSQVCKCRIIECHHENFEDFFKKIKNFTNYFINTPINLTEFPLLNINLFTHSSYESYLVIAAPHIIFDVYSCYLIFNDISKYYNSDLDLNQISDSINKNKYKGFFDSINSSVENQIAKKAEDFFKMELDGIKNLDILQIKESRNSEGLLQGKFISFLLGSNRFDKLQKLLKSRHISEFSFFLTVYGVFLNKVLGEQKIVTGIPLANRKQLDVIGYFINTLPAVLNIQSVKTFSELCLEHAAKTYDMLRYDDFDFSKFDGSNFQGIINNVFTYHKRPILLELMECKVSSVELDKTILSYNLSGVVEKLNNDFLINIGFGHYFDNIEIDKIICCIIDQILNNIDIKVEDIKIIDEDGIKETYKEINNYNPLLGNDTIVNRFKQMAAQNNECIALDYNGVEWTYAQLNRVSNKIAQYITNTYPLTDKIVISLKRNNYLIATILGVLKAGKTYVPIDLISPLKRIDYILNDLGNVSIIGEQEVIDGISTPGCHKVSVQEMVDNISHLDDADIASSPASTDGAYMIYTSGSTGNPKGVVVSHRNLISLIDCAIKQFNFNNRDVWTLFHSYGFDYSVWEIFGCLLSGGKLIIVDNLSCQSPDDYYVLVSEKRVTVLNQTPTSFVEFIDQDKLLSSCLSLRYVFLGGEALYFSFLEPWLLRHKLSDVKIINIYGITETSIITTFYKITEQDVRSNTKSVIGSCFHNQGIYIVDKSMNILPKGVPGEIIIYGDSVTDGYYNNSQLTSEKFIRLDNIRNDTIFYRSGDLAVINSENQIEYLGRIDKQIKLRGYRIELGEIENAILRELVYKTCAVDLVRLSEDDEHLIAYVVQGSKEIEQVEIKNRLRTVLPSYMIPTIFVSVDSIPMTTNGKIDFESLQGNIDYGTNVDGIENQTEKKLSEIIISVAKTGNFSTTDNLFDIGITSIHLPKIHYEIIQDFNFDKLEIVDLFQYPTIHTLAQYIESKTARQNSDGNSIRINRGNLRRTAINQNIERGKSNEQ